MYPEGVIQEAHGQISAREDRESGEGSPPEQPKRGQTAESGVDPLQ